VLVLKIYYIKYPKKTTVILILIIIIAIILLGMLVNHSISTFKTNDPIYKGDANSKKIAFACNVAWGNEYIPKMLEIFKSNNIKITFFFEGQWAEKNPEIVRQIATDGHEIASHGYTHVKYTQWSREKYAADISKAGDVLFKITGKKPNLFAPPYGDFNDDVVKTAEDLGYKVILWSLDTIDWSNPGVNNIIDRVVKKAHNGAIVLMHPTKGTVEALPTMIKELESKGYEITSVSNVLK
jgi:probable sporulation protein (polysaccharide deacetylase family)